MLVEVFSYFPPGHVVRQFVPSKYLTPEQLKQLLFPAPLHVSQSGWQESQVFVTAFSNRFVATQAVGHVDPSRYLPFGQLLH